MKLLHRVLGLLAVLIGQASAQTEGVTVDSPPLALARAALGQRPGTAVAAVWRDGQLQQAGLRDGQPLADDLLNGPQAPLFEYGSISKVFTGLLLAQAVERGELSLDDTLAQRLQGAVARASPATGGITLRQLVTHTSCLPRMPADFGRAPARGYREYDRARLWAALAALPLASAPPCPPAYSNFGFAVLAETLSLRLGQPWAQLVDERIARPLGLQDTVLALGDRADRRAAPFFDTASTQPWEMQAFAGAGGLMGSAADLVRLGRAVMAGRNGPLGMAAERLVAPQWQGGPEIGHAVMIRGPADRRTWLHDGATAGYRTLWMALPDRNQVIVVLTSNGAAAIGGLSSALLASRYPVQAGRDITDPQRLPDYAGVYRSDDGAALTVVLQDGALWVRPTGLGFERLQGAGEDRFTLRDRAAFVFERVDGQVQGLHTQGGGVERSLRRSAEPAPSVARQSAEVLSPYVGRYNGGGLDFSVQQQDGVLRVKLNDQPRFPVFPVPGEADRFAYDVVKAQLQFERYANGQVRALVLHQNGQARTVPRAD